ncbi:hypothetical protein NQD34_013493 [Periophthalmus magnuspinnatus]|nr:hypothetical protein NQD34_013493 [Periophthalmus magnuspinnatus]
MSVTLGFVGFSEFDYLTKTVHFFGAPSDKLLNEALYTSKYFVQDNSKWRLKTWPELKETTGMTPEMSSYQPPATNLEQLLKTPRMFVSDQESRDMEQFHDLLRKMFELNAEERIAPGEALSHPFITMNRLPEGDDYTNMAHELMRVTEAEFGPSQQDSYKYDQDVEMIDMEA